MSWTGKEQAELGLVVVLSQIHEMSPRSPPNISLFFAVPPLPPTIYLFEQSIR